MPKRRRGICVAGGRVAALEVPVRGNSEEHPRFSQKRRASPMSSLREIAAELEAQGRVTPSGGA